MSLVVKWLLVLALISCGHHFKPQEASEIGGSSIAVGKPAPAVTMLRASGSQVALADVIRAHQRTVLTFYRGFY